MPEIKKYELPISRPPNLEDAFFEIGGDKNANSKNLSEALQGCGRLHHAQAYYGNLRGIDTGMNIREPFSRKNYDAYRPNEALPVLHREIIGQCNLAYRKVGLIRNIIDLMADFGSQGISICHPTRSTERFLRAWAERVNMVERSERFLNLLYRSGNVIIRRHTAKLPPSVKGEWINTQAAPDLEYRKPENPEKREIPVRYTFLDPQVVDVIAPEISKFVGKIRYVLRPGILQGMLLKPRNEIERRMVAELPDEIRQLIEKGAKEIPLPEDKTLVYHYKKDDWQIWADPLIYSILDDVILYEKAKLADMAALDGAISAIRIFKLGNLDKNIYPKAAALTQLQDIISANAGGGPIDLVWTPDIEIAQTETNVHQFLGSDKYGPILNAIYDGMGVPSSMTSKSSGSTGFTNNALSLKTLTERLEYGRNLLRDFWKKELIQVQKACGLSKPAQIKFSYMDLEDAAANKALLVQLFDRGCLSWESIVEAFDGDVEVEKTRLRRETRDRAKNRLPKKAGPFHNPQQDFDLKKIFAQSGAITPGQLGMKLEEPGPNEKNKHEQMVELVKLKPPPSSSPKGVAGQGRPKNSTDKKKRKTKTVKPKKASVASVLEVIQASVLASFGVESILDLNTEQETQVKSLIVAVLDQIGSDAVTPLRVKEALECLS